MFLHVSEMLGSETCCCPTLSLIKLLTCKALLQSLQDNEELSRSGLVMVIVNSGIDESLVDQELDSLSAYHQTIT